MKEKAEKKQSFLNRKRAEWKEMKLWNGNELCKVDWIVSILILTVLFFTCVHSDVKLTGNRSFLMYKHFSDFYQASYEQSGWKPVESLDETERGAGGFGHSGEK